MYRVDGFLAIICVFSAMADCISAKSHALNRALKCFKFFIEVCHFFSPFDHIQTSEVCNSPYKPY